MFNVHSAKAQGKLPSANSAISRFEPPISPPAKAGGNLKEINQLL
jgi:hypothetical protein